MLAEAAQELVLGAVVDAESLSAGGVLIRRGRRFRRRRTDHLVRVPVGGGLKGLVVTAELGDVPLAA